MTAAASRGSSASRARRRRWPAPRSEIERLIYPVSFYRHKAVHVRQTCEQILSRFGGTVPRTMEELLTLPGVGRKTANLVLILAHRSAENICVDTTSTASRTASAGWRPARRRKPSTRYTPPPIDDGGR